MNITLCKRTVKLPKKTISVVEEIERLEKIEAQYERREVGAVDCVTAEYNFLVFLYGQDNVNEIFEGEQLEDIDTSDISVAVIDTISAFSRPVDEAKMRRAADVLNTQGFKRVEAAAKAVKND